VFEGAFWRRPPLHVDAAVKMPEGHPIMARLTGLTATPFA
jgi:hypothetical protein